MAFNVQYLNLCSGSTNSETPAIYTYNSPDDSLSTITNTTYFGSVVAEFTVGDYIFISGKTSSSNLHGNRAIFYVNSIDINKKLVKLAPLISQSGAVSSWVTLEQQDVSFDYFLEPNTGYIVKNITNPRNYILYLPSIDQLSVGNTISIAYGANAAGVNIIIAQDAGQQIILPNGLSTTPGEFVFSNNTANMKGCVVLNSAADGITLSVTNSDLQSVIFSGTDVTGVIEFL